MRFEKIQGNLAFFQRLFKQFIEGLVNQCHSQILIGVNSLF
ncbi:hypothetical protein EBME_2146 [bacterium endosymbiont of Mortierella elongata FMR23-6]|nr:hypothetical protein EBME_2146 [bacterium endosymbiont of Mortierella elongata FMR23-6]